MTALYECAEPDFLPSFFVLTLDTWAKHVEIQCARFYMSLPLALYSWPLTDQWAFRSGSRMTRWVIKSLDKVRNFACLLLPGLRYCVPCAASEHLSQGLHRSEAFQAWGSSTMKHTFSTLDRSLLCFFFCELFLILCCFIPCFACCSEKKVCCCFVLLTQKESLIFYLLFPFIEKEKWGKILFYL